jgi:predicted nucleic acid-binding protein
MADLVLIDTSIWINLLRGTAQPGQADHVRKLMQDAQAAWCGMVRLELWAGVRDERERKQLRALDGALIDLPVTAKEWMLAARLADRGRASGISAPATDLLIAACSRAHRAKMLHDDRHFDLLDKVSLD